VDSDGRLRVMAWVGSEVLPHEAAVRAWLRRMIDADDIEDVIQESYCRISGLADVAHILNGRAYLFTTARSIVLERIRRSRVVSIDTATEIDALDIVYDEPSAERITAARRELARVQRLIEGLPDRCRRIFELRKVDGFSQREVADRMGVPEHTVENDVVKGLRLILKAMAEGDERAEKALTNAGQDERTRDSTGDQ